MMFSKCGLEFVEYFAQGWSDPGEFRLVRGRQFPQCPPAMRGKPDQHLPAIVPVLRFPHEPVGFHSVDQADSAVMLDFQLFREFTHRQIIALPETTNRQHGLVLLR